MTASPEPTPLHEALRALADSDDANAIGLAFYVTGPGSAMGPGIGTVTWWLDRLRAIAAQVADLERENERLRARYEKTDEQLQHDISEGSCDDPWVCCVHQRVVGDVD